jgi:hypothetical protein
MGKHGDLADPEYEPTDEELHELSRSAFSGVAARNEEALRRVHEEIAVLRKGLMLRADLKPSTEPPK